MIIKEYIPISDLSNPSPIKGSLNYTLSSIVQNLFRDMKVLITLVLIIATGALAQDFGNCKACEYGLKVFFGHLRSQHGVNFQIAELSREVCPHQPHPFFCDWEVGRNWAGNSI